LPDLRNEDLTESVAKYAGSSGLRYSRYNHEKAIDNMDKFRDVMRNNKPITPPYEEGVMMEPETLTQVRDGYSQYIRGYFAAPRTGKYRFYLSGFG
jgi:hypothetical protein